MVGLDPIYRSAEVQLVHLQWLCARHEHANTTSDRMDTAWIQGEPLGTRILSKTGVIGELVNKHNSAKLNALAPQL